MPIIQKTAADIAAMYEREEPIHLYPGFSIEWAFKRPGADRSLLGVRYHVAGKMEPEYKYEVWEVGGG